MTTPSKPSVCLSSPVTIAGENDARRSSSSAGTSTCAGHDRRDAARQSPAGTARTRRPRAAARSCSTIGSAWCESTLVSPWPGKCLPHAATPSACSVRMITAPSRGDIVGLCRERAIADDRVVGIRVDVEHGRVVEVDADGAQLGGERRREPRRELVVAAPAERDGRRPLGERRLQPRDAAAFLIDADPERPLAREPGALRARARATCAGSTTLRAK